MSEQFRRRHFLHSCMPIVLAIASAGSRAGQVVDWLVTPDEVARLRDSSVEPLFFPKSVGAPTIEVIRPVLSTTALASPLPIELAFRAGADATIDVTSFRVFYGAFQLDVTQRLLKSVAVRPDGLRVEEAAVPSGNHRLVLQIADTRQRVATRELRFAVQ